MSRPIVCDVCDHRDMLDSYGLPPKTWIQLQVNYQRFDLCTTGCAVRKLQELNTRDAAALEVAGG